MCLCAVAQKQEVQWPMKGEVSKDGKYTTPDLPPAGLAGLKWLQLGQGGVRSRHASFDLSPLSRLTGLEHLQFACDSQQVSLSMGQLDVWSACSSPVTASR